MSAFDYKSLKAHVGHKIECVYYGDPEDPANVAVECTDCGEVLMDYDKPSPEDEYQCQSCGATFESPDHGGCPKCFSQNYCKLTEDEEEDKEEDPTCPKCGANIRHDVFECSSCGAKL